MNFVKDKTSGLYKATFQTADGKTKSVATKCSDLKSAKQVVKDSKLRELEMAARSGRISQQAVNQILAGSRMTIEKAIPQWQAWLRSKGDSENTITNHTIYLHAWSNAMNVANLPPSAITERHIADWVNNPDGEAKASTRTVMLSVVRSLFWFCCAKGWCLGDPSKLVRVRYGLLTHRQKEPKQKTIFNNQEIRDLLNNTEPGSFWHSAIAIGRFTGLRIGDICQLQWDCFSKPGVMIVWTDKRDRRVELPIEPEPLVRAIQAMPELHKVYCFPEEQKTITDPKRRFIFSVQFPRLCAKFGITGRTFHSLRHTYATEAYRLGIPTPHISKALGHQYERTTDGYISRD